MDTTKQAAERWSADEPPHPDERARARAYLDLWERYLVHEAVHGRPPAAGVRPPER